MHPRVSGRLDYRIQQRENVLSKDTQRLLNIIFGSWIIRDVWKEEFVEEEEEEVEEMEKEELPEGGGQVGTTGGEQERRGEEHEREGEKKGPRKGGKRYGVYLGRSERKRNCSSDKGEDIWRASQEGGKRGKKEERREIREVEECKENHGRL